MIDNRTLDEIQKDEAEQYDRAISKSQRFEFLSRDQAYKFQGACVQKAMISLGVVITKHSDPKMVDRQMSVAGVTVEKRRYHEPKDVWKTGVYIYKEKDGELAYYISEVKMNHPNAFAIDRRQRWAVMTNVPVGGAKRIISLPGMPAMGVKGKR